MAVREGDLAALPGFRALIEPQPSAEALSWSRWLARNGQTASDEVTLSAPPLEEPEKPELPEEPDGVAAAALLEPEPAEAPEPAVGSVSDLTRPALPPEPEVQPVRVTLPVLNPLPVPDAESLPPPPPPVIMPELLLPAPPPPVEPEPTPEPTPLPEAEAVPPPSFVDCTVPEQILPEAPACLTESHQPVGGDGALWWKAGLGLALLGGLIWMATGTGQRTEPQPVEPTLRQEAPASTSTSSIPEATSTVPPEPVEPSLSSVPSHETSIQEAKSAPSDRQTEPRQQSESAAESPQMAEERPPITPSPPMTLTHPGIASVKPLPRRLPRIKPRRVTSPLAVAEPAPEPQQPPASRVESPSLVVSYGCFSNPRELQQRQERIEARGWPVSFSHYFIQQTVMTCLYSGPFSTMQEADQATGLFEEKGCLQFPRGLTRARE